MRGRVVTAVVVALASLAVTAGGIAVSLVTSDRWPGWLQPYRRWGWWAVLGLGLGAAGLAVWQARRQASESSGGASATTSITAADSGAVGRRDVSVTGGAGPTAGRDATSIVGGQGPIAGRDVVIHHHPPGVSAAEPSLEPREPGPVSNLPPRNPNFTGRRELLEQLTRNLRPGSVAALVSQPPAGQRAPADGGVQALAGMPGVGKSQLALEYAHRHAADYQISWWVPSEEPLAIPTALAGLAHRLGLGEQADQEETVARVLAELGRRDGWLLVFDNAVHPRDLAGYQPSSGGGHVLVTTRTRAFGGVAIQLEVGVLGREEAATFLQQRTGGGQAAAETLAQELGELPLALEQAAAFMEQTGLGLEEYLGLYQQNREALLDKGEPVAYGATVDATFRLAIEQVAERSNTSVALVELCAFLAPEVIPHHLLANKPEVLPAALGQIVSDRVAYAEVVGVLHGFSLLERDQAGLRVHRLVQAVTRHRLDPQEQTGLAARSVLLVQAAWPAEPWLPAAWPRCGQLLPHALAAAEHAEELGAARKSTAALLNDVGLYLWGRAELPAARATLERALATAESVYGPDHPEVAQILGNLGIVLAGLEELPQARALMERVLAIKETAYGADHLEVARTLVNLGGVHYKLDELPQARARYEQALAIEEPAYGPDHPEVAQTLANLGNVHLGLRELPDARRLMEQALAIFEAAYGSDRPELAQALDNLGVVLREHGELPQARARHERALAIEEAAYGPDHPDIAITLSNLGVVLRALGELSQAQAHEQRAQTIRQKLNRSQ